MKKRAFTAVFFALLGAAVFAQNPPPSVSDFAGTWTAEFHKQVWMKLTLTPDKGALSGTLEHSIQISADNEGDITKVDEEMATDTVVSVELSGDMLQIQTKDADGDVDRYRMVLTGKDAADLRAVTTDGIAAPKPFKLRRAASTPTK